MIQWLKNLVWRLRYGVTEEQIDEGIDNLLDRRSVHTGALSKALKDEQRKGTR